MRRTLAVGHGLCLFLLSTTLLLTPPLVAWSQQAPEYKGVFEPVNYPEDLLFNDVYFVDVDVGYVAGQAGTILKTTDGGDTWEIQLGGDAQSPADEIRDLRFIDETHGWATHVAGAGRGTGAALLATVDGITWEERGQIAKNYGDLAFASASTGVYVASKQVFQTQDGGKSWQPVTECAAKAEVDGLTRSLDCDFYELTFATPSVGYALATHDSPNVAIVFKTEDGGASWNVVSTLPGENGRRGEIAFSSPTTGYLRTYANKFFQTTDGGRSWHGIAGVSFDDASQIRFADPEVGWAIGFRWSGISTVTHKTLVYTTDGGQRWAARSIALPAGVRAFSLPRRDRGYVVGEHGMIYRYRVVQADENVAKAAAAPLMPLFDSPLDEQLAQFDAELTGLAAAAAASDSAPDGLADDVARQLDATGEILTAAGNEMPVFVGRFKNLNLLLVGVAMAADLPAQLQGLREAFETLQQATEPQAVAAAVPEVRSKAQGFLEVVRGYSQED